MAISRSRRTMRASVRFATLAQTISSTNPAVPSSTNSVGLNARVNFFLKRNRAHAIAIRLAVDVGMPVCSPAATTSRSARALSRVTPGFIRPNACIMRVAPVCR